MTSLSLADYFADLPDPRISAKCDHRSLDIILLSICAVLMSTRNFIGNAIRVV